MGCCSSANSYIEPDNIKNKPTSKFPKHPTCSSDFEVQNKNKEPFPRVSADPSLQDALLGTEKSEIKPYIKSSCDQIDERIDDIPAIYKQLPSEIYQYIVQLGRYGHQNDIIYEGVDYKLKNFSNGEIYEGQMLGDKKHGYGYHFKERSFYEGYFENDQRTGCGREVFQNGDYKIGNWKENKIEGNGTLKQRNCEYIGEWVKDRPNGKGYEGDFSCGKLHGQGQKFTFLDQTEYIGQFQDNRMHGYGILKFKDKQYIGDFFNNKFEGKGEMSYSDGSKYEGMYKNNFREGKGRMIMADGSIKQEGEWLEDEFKQ